MALIFGVIFGVIVVAIVGAIVAVCVLVICSKKFREMIGRKLQILRKVCAPLMFS